MLIVAGMVIIIALVLIVNAIFRVTVNPNEVHVVQYAGSTVAYGKDFESRVYYNWRPWLPFVWCVSTVLPTSVFDVTISNYQAYDIGRVPFWIDVKAFFRIESPVLAAERILNFDELVTQLHDVLKSSIRSILAWADIEEILSGRSEFSDRFTKAVKEQLSQDRWVGVVKNIEFMEIRDWTDSSVISNIQKKKESLILKQSRLEIAENNKAAEVWEIQAKQEAEIKAQEAREVVGKRTVEAEKQIQIEQEKANQLVKEQSKITAERDMEVQRVQEVKAAEIAKDKEVVDADKEARKIIIAAEAEKAKADVDAKAIATLAQAKAGEIKSIWVAEGDAIKAKEIALISGKVELMEKMQSNIEYANYLQAIEAINAQKDIGVANAKALESADIKYLWTDKFNPAKSLTEVLTPSWLAWLWMWLDAFTNFTDNTIVDLFHKFAKMSKEKQDAVVEIIQTGEEEGE